jgi:hypothetical protein
MVSLLDNEPGRDFVDSKALEITRDQFCKHLFPRQNYEII